MGVAICNCYKAKTSHEIIVDELFASLPIRKISIDKLKEIIYGQLGNSPQITETIFQKICNRICCIEERKTMLHTYWGRVFNSIQRKKQTLILVFFLFLLCKHQPGKETIEKFVELFDSAYGDSNTNTETEDNMGTAGKLKRNVKIVGVELREFLYSYFYCISYLTIDNFDVLTNNKENFRDFLSEVWNPTKIWRYITNKFFEQKNNLTNQIDLRKFFTNNIDFLTNDVLIRKEITEYVYKEVGDGEEYLDMSKVRKKNYT